MSTCGTIEVFQPADEPGAGRAADARRIAKLEARLETHKYQTRINVLEARNAELETKLTSQAREMTAARKRDEALASLSPFDVFLVTLLPLIALVAHDPQARFILIAVIGLTCVVRSMNVVNIREVFARERDGKPAKCDSWFGQQ
jgi:hypothetical protein